MDKFLNKLFDETPLWKAWLFSLPIFFLIAFSMFYFLGDVVNLTGTLVASGIITVVFSLALPLFISLYRSGNKFYRFAETIEQLILDGHDKIEVFEKLIELQKLSFHRTTGERLNELGKMFEVKYGDKILKR